MARVMVTWRFAQEILDRVDAHLERMRAQVPGADLTRTDAARNLLLFALDSAEEHAGEGAGR